MHAIGRQVSGLRQLHKADPVGRGSYPVVGFGEQSVPQMLALALALHAALDTHNARAAAAGHRRWRLRIGIARGGVVTGGLSAERRRCCFFGAAVAEADRLARACHPGHVLLQRGLARADGARAFAFAPAPGLEAPGAAVALVGRRQAIFGLP